MKYSALVEKIQEAERHYGYFVVPRATEQKIEALRQRVSVALGTDLPDPYAAFLQISDGLSWNGITIFGCEDRDIPVGPRTFVLEGCVEANLSCRDMRGFEFLFMFGQADMDYYVRDNRTGLYCIIDRVSLYPYETFGSFDDLITESLLRYWDS